MSQHPWFKRAVTGCALSCCIAAWIGCGEESDRSGSEGGGNGGRGGQSGGGGGGSGGFDPLNPSAGINAGSGGTVDAGELDVDGAANACATIGATASLEPLHLVFAFDVSGSMGKGDEPWHDK